MDTTGEQKDYKCRNCVRMTVPQDEYINIMEEQCREYEAQIDLMKSTVNCVHGHGGYHTDYGCDLRKNFKCIGCPDWEYKDCRTL